jgi:hypothetical protein
MTTPSKPYVKPLPVPKSKLYEMLAQAVRNTQPELNRDPPSTPEAKAKQRGRPTRRLPAQRPAQGRKVRA